MSTSRDSYLEFALDYVKENKISIRKKVSVPLIILLCNKCGHAQLSHVINEKDKA